MFLELKLEGHVREYIPVGSCQKQAQDSHSMYSATQGRRGQAPGTEPQEGIPEDTCGE